MIRSSKLCLAVVASLFLVLLWFFLRESHETPAIETTKPNGNLRIVFDRGLSSVAVEIVRTITDPPFLQVTPSRNDSCKNFPGEIVRTRGFFAPVETSLFHHLLKEGCHRTSGGKQPLVVDVGGNIGYFANYAASCGCRVIVFEPIPNIIRYLNLTVAVNGFQNRIAVHQSAASDKVGKGSASMNCYDTGLSGVNSKGDIGIVMEKIDDVVSEDVLLLKIDTEGYEDAVLRGAEKLFANHKVDNIICETKKNNDIQYKVDFINSMIDSGYKVGSYQEHYPGEVNFWSSRLSQSFDFSLLKDIASVDRTDWIPHEDLWFRKIE